MAKRSRLGRGRRGLRKLSPELIAQAQGQTAATITRTMLTFVGVAVFCVLSLLTPDAALVTGGERLNVPFARPVSFRGFIIIGPMLLIALRVYLQIYVHHWCKLGRISRLPERWVPTLAPLHNPLLRIFVGFVLYLALPLTMLAFTWKAAVLPAWGSGLLGVTVAVIAGHLLLSFRWRWLLMMSFLTGVGGFLFAAAAANSSGWPVSRPADLFRANLSSQYLALANLRDAWLFSADLRGANLQEANLRGAKLRGASLRNASLYSADLGRVDLWNADLGGADLWGADLGGANLEEADLEGAEFGGANLGGANLRGANIKGSNFAAARNLVQSQLDLACGDGTTKLPLGLKVGTCWWYEETQ